MFGRKKPEENDLTIRFEESDGTVTVHLAGKLDTVTSQQFTEEVPPVCAGKTTILDMAGLRYISSAGLRAILALDKYIGKEFRLSIVNAKDEVRLKEVIDECSVSLSLSFSGSSATMDITFLSGTMPNLTVSSIFSPPLYHPLIRDMIKSFIIS